MNSMTWKSAPLRTLRRLTSFGSIGPGNGPHRSWKGGTRRSFIAWSLKYRSKSLVDPDTSCALSLPSCTSFSHISTRSVILQSCCYGAYMRFSGSATPRDRRIKTNRPKLLWGHKCIEQKPLVGTRGTWGGANIAWFFDVRPCCTQVVGELQWFPNLWEIAQNHLKCSRYP